MYESYWHLTEKPFENTPDPRFIYLSPKHEEALSRLLYCINERKGAVLLTGEYGSGKTLLSRVLLNELASDDYRIAFIFNPRLPAIDLLREIIYQLGSAPDSSADKTGLLHQLNEILYKNRNEDKRTVVVVDEAQAIPDANGLEELRLLLNFQLNDSFLLTLVLMGQPELKEKIAQLPQFRQRLAVHFHLTALSRLETKKYIEHRMAVAGGREDIFSPSAITEIYKYSAGIPRRINNICDLALLTACGKEVIRVSKKIAEDVGKDLGEIPLAVETPGGAANG